MEPFKVRGRVLTVEYFRINPFDLHLHAVRHASMSQSLRNGFVGIFQLSVLANNSDPNLAFGVVDAIGNIFPDGKVRFWRWTDLEGIEYSLIETFAVIGQRRFVN